MSKNKKIINYQYETLPNLFYNIADQEKVNNLLSFLYEFPGKIIFSLTDNESLKNILNYLKKNKIHPQYIKNTIEINRNIHYFYTVKYLKQGFIDKKNNFLFLCTENLLPLINMQYFYKKKNDIYRLNNDNFSKIAIGHPIIHLDHGVGRYQGLTSIKTASLQSEYLIISYAEENKLYVPISSLHLVTPYTKTSIENAPLHKLGHDDWNKTKIKIKKTIYDHASQLLDIYARRKSKKGFSFKKNEKIYKIFSEDCDFQTTKEQDKVIISVLKDMYKSVPMDRLICGDVGFGKTEIAMRATFLSVFNKKQVAILVPTTLLAEQHCKSFKKRFFKWNINIEILSRFQDIEKQKMILKNTQQGIIDVLIGTHKILLRQIKWFDLGLLIIDEEHKFGVNHKESIKKQYPNVDILTLTATPIPRTLNMTMIGIKDISIIEKPPAQRLAIKTFIKEYNPLLVRKTILREILRGGQVYYVYNKVKNITNIAKKLSKLIPEATIKIGHAKMNNIHLKKVMNDFYNNKFNVLICTTIIESGIDIPRANTIIIENSDHFGLSQLHQLRGRIGRSNNQAYALFLVNAFNQITVDAKKRLEAIASVDNFGGGFSLSNKDLEIRGIGELLGKEQSGHIKTIGFSLYIKLLKNAINLLKKGKNLHSNKLLNNPVEIELHVSSLFPENYIFDINTRLFFYKKLENAKSEKEIKKIKQELINNFGELPVFSKNLIMTAIIRLMAIKIGIKSIKFNKKIGIIEFSDNHSANIEYLLKMLKKNPDIWKIEDNKKLKFLHNSEDDFSLLNWTIKFLKNLEKK